MVYQNIRLLALATFTSLADPLGIAARTGNLGLVFHGFKEAVKTIFNNNQSEVKDLAEMLGIIDYAVVNEALGWEYGGAYMTGTARKFNEGFFKWSGLTGWTRMTRIMATASATKFIARHKARPNKHSTRYLEELNLTAGDVLLDKDGGLKVLSYAERKTASATEIARDDKIRAAIVRFVDESILRPNPSQRPPWASDPHYMLAFHLKSFMYSFHDRILKRVWHEMQHGNFTHLVGLMAYVPAMIAADLVREIIQYGGDDPKKANWGMMDYAGSGFVRAGLPGVPGLTAYDIMRDYQYGGIPGISLAGPTIEQITDPSIQKAMPLNSIKWLYN